MLTIYADVESFYSKEYSLQRLTPPEYVLGAEWETIGWGVAEDNGTPFWLEGDQFQDYLSRLGATNFRLVTHNALFDACVIGWRYGVYPRLCVDTMSMARALLSHKLPRGSVSLENVGEYLQAGVKGDAVRSVLGMHLADIKAAGLYERYTAYCLNDVSMTRNIYKALAPSFPLQEFIINDAIIKMATRPQFQINVEKLYEHLGKIRADKQTLLDRVGMGDKDALMSNDKFAIALQQLGVAPPRKTSPTTGKETWAFAKSDQAFSDLAEHPDPDVQALHAARVGHKSTLEESRTERFINIANVTYDGNASHMPIPLRFSGAHTHRFSGDWKLNGQNLPSRKNTSLRQSLIAPDGYDVVVVDASQIEARLTAWLSGQWDLVEQFANGEDVYSLFAGDMYGVTVTKADKPRRLGGKISILGLGFQMGPPKFKDTWRIQSADAGMPTELDDLEASRVVNLYRSKFFHIRDTWAWWQRMIPGMANGSAAGTQFGPCVIEEQAILLPSGLRLHYEGLHYKENEWWYTYAGKPKKTYGGKLLENCLAGDTRVLTSRGWTPIVDISIDDKVWDGHEWVGHAGVTHQGNKPTISIDGVRMTDDHLVRTERYGWVRAASTEGLHRAAVRLPNGYPGCGDDGPEAPIRSTGYEEQVYDVVNCGPRHQFVVLGVSGPFIVHNCVQALDRVCVMDAAVRIHQRAPQYPLAHQVHDELVYVVHKSDTPWFKSMIVEEMARRPWWGPDLPLAADANHGPNYGECK